MIRLTKKTIIRNSLGILALGIVNSSCQEKNVHPNIILIYADDLGWGDIGCNGSPTISTPNIDRAASEGLRFTNAHCTSATSTPSRYSLLTGQYAWRRTGTGIAPGNAGAIILPGTATIASVLQNAGYTTGVVGKWHLGLGPEGGPDWNGEISPGPMDIGFDYNFLIPATGDRVPCVYVENRRIANLDPDDPVVVSYTEKIGNEPTGRDNPELLKMHPSHGHDMAIINGISRIGYMTGGNSALWTDEDMADVITGKAVNFIRENSENPFFLYFATHDIHVPRVPHPRFSGKSGMGPRGDAIVEFDWSVGEIIRTIDELELSDKTIVIITSDNGPVVDDGYRDDAVEKLGSHKPSGPLRGGKYSAFNGGTRIPMIVKWPDHVKPGVSDALVSQIDMLASLASLAGCEVPENTAEDSFDQLNTYIGKSREGRDWIIGHALNGRLSLIKGDWKLIRPGPGPKVATYTNIELGNDTLPQLYNLKHDIGERNNLALENQKTVNELTDLLEELELGNIVPACSPIKDHN
ncbi:MAG: arylsulfatase [Bacteroidales bacterium]|jgi:arylsulfatase A-like enzyme|nr:arylsulfatase [Bacteroidales bacterium]